MFSVIRNGAKGIQQFFSWWFYALALLIPSPLRDFVSGRGPRLFIRLHNFQVFFSYFERGTEKPLLSCYQHKEGIQQQAAFFKAHPKWRHAEKILLLDVKQLLKTRLDLPLAAQQNLAQVVAYELDRYTPFTPEQCYFATQVVGKNPAGNRLLVELLCVAKAKFEQYCQDLAALGLTADVIAHASDAGQYGGHNVYPQPYNLLPLARRPQLRRDLQWLQRLLAVGLVLLLVVAVALPFWAQWRTLTDLKQQVAVAKSKTQVVDALQTETNRLLQAGKKAVALKRQAPAMINIVEHLSQILPKDTWLKSFEYTDKRFLLQGVSAASSGLIGLLEDSPYFKQTSMVSPVTLDSQGALDQFQLETYLESAHDTE